MISPQTFVLILILVLSATVGIIYFLSTQINKLKTDLKGDENNVLMEWLKEMKGSVDKNSDVLEKQLREQRQTLDEQMKGQREALSQQTKLIWERLDNASQVISGVQKQLGGIEEFGKDMKDLSNILKSPKLRGGLGEQFLYEILANCLPNDLYKTQYKFKNGAICDAIVITEKGLIPIDSKFPMENFKAMLTCENNDDRDKFKKTFMNDVKKRIDEISSKYILPQEGTTEQAVMYIPSENIFYELIVNSPQIEEYAKQRSVVMTSPNTLSYFLKIILVAFQQNQLQKNAGEILKALSGIKIEAEKLNEDMSVLEKHISNSYNSVGAIRGKYQKFLNNIDAVRLLEKPEEKKLLE